MPSSIVLLLEVTDATGAVMPYDVVRPKSIFADVAPARVVDQVMVATDPIIVLISDDCVNEQLAEPPPLPAVPLAPALPVVPPRPAFPLPPRPAVPVVPAVDTEPPV